MTKLLTFCWNHVLFILCSLVTFNKCWITLSDLNIFTKLSGIDPCKKCINILGGHAWRNFSMACSKLEAMAIYVVKQAGGNDIMASCITYVNYFRLLFRIEGKWGDLSLSMGHSKRNTFRRSCIKSSDSLFTRLFTIGTVSNLNKCITCHTASISFWIPKRQAISTEGVFSS